MEQLNLNRKYKYLLAISGGSDSMALADMLIKQHYDVCFAHVNYHHRQESNYEQKMIEEYALKNHIKVFIKQAYYENQNRNFENWAREIRYQFFSETIKKNNLYGCLVAHHQDDLIETYLMQKKRGYVLNYGIKYQTIIKNILIIRPLLNFTKYDLEKYCLQNEIPYSFDITNDDLTLSRNKIRHQIVKKLDKDQRAKLLNEIAYENQKIELINDKIKKMDVKNLKINDLQALDEEIFHRLLFKIANDEDESLILSKKRLDEIRKILINSKGNQKIRLNSSYYFLKEYESLKLVKKERYNYDITIKTPQIVDNRFIYFDLITNPKRFYINEDSYPLTIRIVSKKDIIKIGNIHKTINRLFIDEKIPFLKRQYWPKIVDCYGKIIFVPRISADEDGLYVVKNI